MAVLKEQPWSRSLSGYQVHVLDGVVTLEGTVQDIRIGDAARVAVENVPGVRSVVNDILWVDGTMAVAGAYPFA